jgi:hypothetical protein
VVIGQHTQVQMLWAAEGYEQHAQHSSVFISMAMALQLHRSQIDLACTLHG